MRYRLLPVLPAWVLSLLVGAPAAVPPAESELVHRTPEELVWTESPFGPWLAPVMGDAGSGEHVTLFRFEPGMASVPHRHSVGYVGLVLSGNARHWVPGRPETRKLLPPGSTWTMPAEQEHVSECLEGATCVMAVVQAEAFDFRPTEEHPGDAALVAAYDRANSFDIDVALLGVSRGHRREVRELAAAVLRDHAAARQQVRDIARRSGIDYEREVDAAAVWEHERALADLADRRGSAFDRAYLRHELEFHRSAIEAVRRDLLPGLRDPELHASVSAALPVFEHHLERTRAVAADLGVD